MALKPSLRLGILLLLIHAVVAAAVCMLAMPLAARLAIMMLILLSLIYYLARDVLLLLPDSWHGIAVDPGGVSLIDRDGSCFYGHTAGKATVSPYFVVLRFKLEGRRLPVFLTIFPDALEADMFRDLCVRLRLA